MPPAISTVNESFVLVQMAGQSCSKTQSQTLEMSWMTFPQAF